MKNNFSNDNEEEFDFDTWIKQNNFEDIKQILMKHQLNKKSALTITGSEFENFICDPLISTLPVYSQFIPKIFCLLKNYEQNNNKCCCVFKRDDCSTDLLKSSFPSPLKQIIMDFIFDSKCINCNDKIELYSYFCRKCAIKRIHILNEDKIKSSREGYKEYFYEVDQYGIWAIETLWTVTKDYGDGEEDGSESHKIYHILSGDVIFESEGNEYIYDQDYPECYGQTDFSFYNSLADEESLDGYDPTLEYYQKNMVYYKEYDGSKYEDDKNGKRSSRDIAKCFQIDLSQLDSYHQLNWHFECYQPF